MQEQSNIICIIPVGWDMVPVKKRDALIKIEHRLDPNCRGKPSGHVVTALVYFRLECHCLQVHDSDVWPGRPLTIMLDPALETAVLVGFGLAIRTITSAFFPGNFRVSGTLAGLTEGFVQQLFQSRRIVQPEPHLLIPYGSLVVCNLIDAAFTRNVWRVVISVVWACIGMVVLDIVWAAPPAPTRAHFRKRSKAGASIDTTSYSNRHRYLGDDDFETYASSSMPRASSEPPSFDGMYTRETPPERSASTLRSSGFGLYDGDDFSRTSSFMTRSTRKGKGKMPGELYSPASLTTSKSRNKGKSPVENGGEQPGNLSALEMTPVLPKLGFPSGAQALSTIQSGDEVVDPEPERLPDHAYPLTPEPAPVPPPRQASISQALDMANAIPTRPSELVDFASEASPAPSVLSVNGREALISRAELIRQEALEEERVRAGLATEMREALAKGHAKDAFLLKCEMEDAQMRAEKLHERAERRYYQGTVKFPLFLPVG